MTARARNQEELLEFDIMSSQFDNNQTASIIAELNRKIDKLIDQLAKKDEIIEKLASEIEQLAKKDETIRQLNKELKQLSKNQKTKDIISTTIFSKRHPTAHMENELTSKKRAGSDISAEDFPDITTSNKKNKKKKCKGENNTKQENQITNRFAPLCQEQQSDEEEQQDEPTSDDQMEIEDELNKIELIKTRSLPSKRSLAEKLVCQNTSFPTFTNIHKTISQTTPTEKNFPNVFDDNDKDSMKDINEAAPIVNQMNKNQEETSQNSENTEGAIQSTQDTPILKKVPPVILRNKDKYMRMSKLVNTTGINIIKAKTLMDGIAFHPQTELDYRKLVRLFDHQSAEYHTYQLPSEKLLYVAIKGIPEPIETNEIKEELIARGFHPENVSRMRSRKDKRTLHMVLVTVPKSESNIYNVKDILGLIVNVEDQKSSNKVNQCHRCQRFGHAQSRCTARPKCVKCAGNHLTAECNIDKQIPPKCANCL